MNMRRWWPYFAIGGAAVMVLIAYPAYFNWWDHKNCRDSGGPWNETRDQCVEPDNARFESSGSSTFEDDNQAQDKH